jgi:peptidyl-prolyl cis-trans isomerase B (cyclophilin B)
MKNSLLLLLGIGFLGIAGTATADDVAVVNIQTAGDKTTQRVVIEFYEKDAPNTVANFKKLASKNFYNGVAVHRVFPNLMVQTGDPLSKSKSNLDTGTGGPGYTLPPEFSRRKHVAGTVAAARLGDKVNPAKVSNGSQFYIALAPMPNLDGQYTVFGGVVQGLDVLQAISEQAADTNDSPVDRVVIKSVKIIPREEVNTTKTADINWTRTLTFGLFK